MKLTSPQVELRKAIVRRMSSISCLILATYTFVSLTGVAIPTFSEVWIIFIRHVNSFVEPLIPR